MPLYLFEHPETLEIKEIFLSMKEENKDLYKFHIDENGICWKRVFTKPLASVNSTSFDPYSSKDFNRQFDGKKVTVGDMWDASKEASLKRAGVSGQDPIKDKFYKDYSKERRGIKHQAEQKEIADKSLQEMKKQIKKIVQ